MDTKIVDAVVDPKEEQKKADAELEKERAGLPVMASVPEKLIAYSYGQDTVSGVSFSSAVQLIEEGKISRRAAFGIGRFGKGTANVYELRTSEDEQPFAKITRGDRIWRITFSGPHGEQVRTVERSKTLAPSSKKAGKPRIDAGPDFLLVLTKIVNLTIPGLKSEARTGGQESSKTKKLRAELDEAAVALANMISQMMAIPAFANMSAEAMIDMAGVKLSKESTAKVLALLKSQQEDAELGPDENDVEVEVEDQDQDQDDDEPEDEDETE